LVDAREDQRYRAYFTAWHELSHVIITPKRLDQGEVRRIYPESQRNDPVERLVDRVAGRIGFYKPIFREALEAAYDTEPTVSFSLLENALRFAHRPKSDVPSPSLYATARAFVRCAKVPICFLRVDEQLKKEEQRQIDSSQQWLSGLEPERPEPKLRVAEIHYNADGRHSFEIRRNMRIPSSSIIYRTFYREGSRHTEAPVTHEDQGDWETSRDGPLSSLPIAVSAIRRGRYTYALLTPSGG